MTDILMAGASSGETQVKTVLEEHNARYKRLNEDNIYQAPSARLTSGAFVFPGSRSELNHVLFLHTNRHTGLLAVAYSKNTVIATTNRIEKDEILMKMLDSNRENTIAIYKLEERAGSVFPVLEATLFSQETLSKDLIWKTCGVIDAVFKATVPTILPQALCTQEEVFSQVRKFLEFMGFTKLKESQIPNGRSLLVVMSADDEPESTRWKRFPLKVDVTQILAFRIYFSLDDAAVTAKSHFKSAAKRLIAHINSAVRVGYYNYASNSDQIQFTLKLHYKTLTLSDLQTSLKEYYETCIQQYKGTVSALTALHQSAGAADKSLSDVSEYAKLIDEEMRPDEEWIPVKYETQFELERGLSQMRRLRESPALRQYVLPPVFKLHADTVLVRHSRSLLSFTTAVFQYPLIVSDMLKNLLELYAAAKAESVVPSLEAVYCGSHNPTELRIVPNASLSRDSTAFLREIIALQMDVVTKCESSFPYARNDYMELEWSAFDAVTEIHLNYAVLLTATLGAVTCLLYPMQTSHLGFDFSCTLSLYASQLERLPDYRNSLLGWVRSTETAEDECYLCERLEWTLDAAVSPLPTLALIISELQSLHNAGLCHWFLSPLTIRYQDTAAKKAPHLVLPCINPAFSRFVYSVTPPHVRNFLAPEVLSCIHDGLPVSDVYAADVYSLCHMFHSKAVELKEKTATLRRVTETLLRGKQEDWRLRPTLAEIASSLRDI